MRTPAPGLRRRPRSSPAASSADSPAAQKNSIILSTVRGSIPNRRAAARLLSPVAVPLTIPRQKGETQLAIKETTLKGRRYVLCRNEEEARKDAERRAAILAGLERKLTQGDKALVSNKGFRRFVKTIASGNFSIDYDRVAADAKFDGLFVLRTNTRLSALQVVLRYRNLLAVEDAFKTAKALLTTRPIFHKTDAGIRGHVFCSFLAVLLRKALALPLPPSLHQLPSTT